MLPTLIPDANDTDAMSMTASAETKIFFIAVYSFSYVIYIITTQKILS